MTEIDKAYKEWSSICRMFNRKQDPAIYSHKELFDFAKAYHKHMMQGSKLPMHGVSSTLPKKPCKTTSEVAERFYKKGNMMYAVKILSLNTSMTLKECKEYADSNYC